MSFDGNGIYSLPVTTVTPAVSTTTIDSADFNTFTADLETALTLCVANDGQTANPRLNNPYFNEAVNMTSTSTELNLLDGATVTTAEINILDGVTSTAAELNILDGVTSTAAELNYNDITALGAAEASKTVTCDGSTAVSGLTLTSPVIDTGVSGTAIDTDSTLAADSDTILPSQKAIKAYSDNRFQSATSAQLSGAEAEFLSIPAGTRKITLSVYKTASTGTGAHSVQLGISTGYISANYSSNTGIIVGSTASDTFATDQIELTGSIATSQNISGILTLTHVTGNLWSYSGTFSNDVGRNYYVSGAVPLGAELTKINVYNDTGVNALTGNGYVSMIYEL